MQRLNLQITTKELEKNTQQPITHVMARRKALSIMRLHTNWSFTLELHQSGELSKQQHFEEENKVLENCLNFWSES